LILQYHQTTHILHPSSIFFFSSRRRHTRSKRDWSSDVCSSDLRRPHTGDLSWGGIDRRRCMRHLRYGRQEGPARPGSSAADSGRSEERRVGKECGWRGWGGGWWGMWGCERGGEDMSVVVVCEWR